MFDFVKGRQRSSDAQGDAAPQFDLSPHQVALLQLGIAGLVVLVSLNLAGPIAQRMSALPILGIVNPPSLEAAVVENPMTLPAAIAAPANPEATQEVDLSRLDEIFLPPVKEEVAVDLGAKAAEMIRAALASIQISAVATGGAFVNGLFVQSGQSSGINIPVEGGQPLPVMVYASGNRVTLKAGDHSREVVIQ